MDGWISRNLVFCVAIVIAYLYLSSKNEASDAEQPKPPRKNEDPKVCAPPTSTGAQIGAFLDQPIFEWIVIDGRTYDYEGIVGKQITYTLRQKNP